MNIGDNLNLIRKSFIQLTESISKPYNAKWRLPPVSFTIELRKQGSTFKKNTICD